MLELAASNEMKNTLHSQTNIIHNDHNLGNTEEANTNIFQPIELACLDFDAAKRTNLMDPPQ